MRCILQQKRAACETRPTFILLFSTSLSDHTAANSIADWMKQQTAIIRWSIDFSDEEHILKVVCIADISREMQHMLHSKGFIAEAMAIYESAP